jgi:CDP-diacylglycerol--serine O-phosphatidyltransferase
MKKGIYILPNAITLCGMFAGFYAIVAVLNDHFVVACWAILVAGVFDGLDGWVARLTSSATKFGIELDSLSDVICFGVAPSVMLYKWALQPFGRIGWLAAFLFIACGAMRLARYNIQMGTTERKTFTGMPIPAAAGCALSMVLFWNEMGWTPVKSYFILVVTVMLAAFMVSTMKFHSHKEVNLRERKPFWALVLLLMGFVAVATYPEIALFVIAVAYTSVAIVENSYLLLSRAK